MNIEELINNGFRPDMPIYYNKVTVIDYNMEVNQTALCKKVLLKKYNLNGYISNKCYKYLTKISK